MATLEQHVSFLQLQCGFYRRLLAANGGSLAADSPCSIEGGQPELPLHERLELCALETKALQREIAQVQLDSELEMACTAAGIADCRLHQPAETARDLAALLSVLAVTADQTPTPRDLPAASQPEPAATLADTGRQLEQLPPSSSSPSAASIPSPDADGEPAKAAVESYAAALPALLALPTPRQLARAALSGDRLQQFLGGILERHDATAARMQMRNAMLQAGGQLPAGGSALAIKAAQGGATALRRVDFDQLRIERAQAEAEVADATAGAITLKSHVVRGQQRLVDRRTTLADAAADTAQLQGQIDALEAHAAQLLADAGKVRAEAATVERACKQLREQEQERRRLAPHSPGCTAIEAAGAAAVEDDNSKTAPKAAGAANEWSITAGGGADSLADDGPTILSYMQVKNACVQVGKKIADWQRKIEVQAGRRKVHTSTQQRRQ
ncbi:hypothetical protein ACK3TF_002045 [Chlorella vulgaris]